MRRLPPPATLDELSARAAALQGRTLAAIADELDAAVPADLRRAKGWVGQLVEAALGAAGGSRPEPDFLDLGVELKTIPVGDDGAPRESTYVCVAPTEGAFDASWEVSHVRRKLAHVLWVPVSHGGPPGQRIVGRARLWSPSPAEEATLRADWESLTELLAFGELHLINARLGKALQLRPKAADSEDYAWMLDAEGEWVRTVPYGFYLRAGCTGAVIRDS